MCCSLTTAMVQDVNSCLLYTLNSVVCACVDYIVVVTTAIYLICTKHTSPPGITK